MTLRVPWRISIRLTKKSVAAPARLRRKALLFFAGLALAGSVPVTTAAAASTGASATLTIPVVVAVKSITLSSSSLTYQSCLSGTSTSAALGFPNGVCNTPVIQVTTGTAPSNVSILGADAVPADNGAHWQLCWPGQANQIPSGTQGCAQGLNLNNGFNSPSTDQYVECTLPVTEASGCSNSGPWILRQEGVLIASPSCDAAFNNQGTPIGCTNVPAQTTSSEYIYIDGPSSSSDTSNSFTTVVAWEVS